MKKVYLGSFYGNEMMLEVKHDDTFDYVKAWENWVEGTKEQAVQEYKDELFLKELDGKHKSQKAKKLMSFLLGLLVGGFGRK